MKVSGCCGAPIVVEVRSDLPNCTDDEYDLLVSFHVCSKCGAIITDYLHPQGGEDEDAASEGTDLHTSN